MKSIYDAALYLRLSRDDSDIDGINKMESNSISSQRNILREYIKSHDDIRIFDVYIDDGYSGADFDRPEFKRMMEDVYSGKVNCVIVKDLSRFGRDYIEAGRFIQKNFPAFNVRFIAVTDNYDSLHSDNTEQTLVLPVKNFINDSYCRDISMKVRAHQKVKRLQGKCISAFAAYGYFKNPNDRNKLIVDDYAADVVRNIYCWKFSGMSLGKIADKLNNRGIPAPLEYKKLLGMKYSTGFEGTESARWAATSVRRILTNRVYVGDMEQGKSEKISYKVNRRIIKPEEDWISVKNTHKAIVSETDFKIVQELLKTDSGKSGKNDKANIFSGILICADCGKNMIRRVNVRNGKKKVFYICSTKNKSSGCSRHGIGEEVLKRIVLKQINHLIGIMVPSWKISALLDETVISCESVPAYGRMIKTLRNQYGEYAGLKSGLRADLRENIIDEEEFLELDDIYSSKCEELRFYADSQETVIKDMLKSAFAVRKWIDGYKAAGKFNELTRELLVIMISRVLVHEDNKLDVHFRFSGVCADSGQLKIKSGSDGENGRRAGKN